LFLKQAVWRGKAHVPAITRIDIGVIPVPGKGVGGSRFFVNEIEMEACTWLVRYCPFDLVDHMGNVYSKKIQELLDGLDVAGERIKDAGKVAKLRALLKARTASRTSGAARGAKRQRA